MKALLALEDGVHFFGEAFGVPGSTTGEACFNTSMTGYQEVLTDPSYRGQIVAMTYPLIGNYGVNETDNESSGPHVRGFVIGELCRVPSSWRSEMSLEDYFKKWNLLGIEGVDTRRLAKHLRTRGAMRAFLSTEILDPAEATARAAASNPMTGSDFVKEVSTPGSYVWDEKSILSKDWLLPTGEGAAVSTLPATKYRIVAYDFGIKLNILRRLRQEGFHVDVVPASATAEEVLARKPDGVFLSNGPGDPSALGYAYREIEQLIGKTPIFAICLGHQLIGHAVGGKTFKLKFGHRGGNHPVQDLRTGQVAITSQNHGFAVDADSLPSNVEVTHINLNDQTVEGLSHRDAPLFSVQYHPEAAPGPNDARHFFTEFADLIEKSR